MQNFMNLVNNCRVNQEKNDRLVWKGDKNGLNSIRANATLLEGSTGIIAPWKLVWNSIVLPKISFFAWKVWWGKILTMEQLKKRGFQLAGRCPLCGSAEEDLDHLLLHGQTIWSLWGRLISILSFRWACTQSVKELLEGWSVSTIRK